MVEHRLHKGFIFTALAVTLAFVPTTAVASWPGDNGRIAFTAWRDGRSVILSMKPSGQDVRRLSHSSHPDSETTYSPSGRRVLFTRRFRNKGEIFSMTARGSSLIRLTDNSLEEGDPSWAPGGRRLVWSRKSAGGRWDLWTMSSDGSNKSRLATEGGTEWYPAWSPDGDQIAYTKMNAGGLHAITADGTGRRELADWTIGPSSWAPDGDRLAVSGFAGAPDGPGIYIVDEAGTDPRRVTGGEWWSPVFSPDGTRIAARLMESTNSLRRTGIYTMDLDGTHRKLIRKTSGGTGARLDWQPR